MAQSRFAEDSDYWLERIVRQATALCFGKNKNTTETVAKTLATYHICVMTELDA